MAAEMLLGKNVLLTGATRGLGHAIAWAMWQAGANLLLTARSREALIALREKLLADKAQSGEVHICVADLEEGSAPGAILNEARRVWPRLDVLVNNAAILGPVGKSWETNWEEWKATLVVDLVNPVALCRLAVEWMKRTGGGAIVNISGGGATGPRPNFSAYATAKTGMLRFSEILAAEAAADEIRVNCIAPGSMNTALLQAVLEAGPDRVGAEYSKAEEQARNGGASPEVAAALCVYLASERARGITGKLISAIWDPWRELNNHVEDLRDSDIYTLRRIIPADRGRNWE